MTTPGTLPVSPFVRRRWRRRLGLPETFVARLGVPGAPDADAATAAAALFTCSAAVVGVDAVELALALGTPVVCDAEVAGTVGAVDEIHVAVADGTRADAAAEALAGDDARAARLGRNGRRLTVDGSPPPAADPGDPVDAALAALGTPAGSPIAARLLQRIATPGRAARAATVAPTPALPDAAMARRLADLFDLPLRPPVADLAPPSAQPRSIRKRLAGKSARDIAAAVARRLRRQ